MFCKENKIMRTIGDRPEKRGQVCPWLFGTLPPAPPADNPVEALVTVEKETQPLPRAVAELEIDRCVGRLRKAGLSSQGPSDPDSPFLFLLPQNQAFSRARDKFPPSFFPALTMPFDLMYIQLVQTYIINIQMDSKWILKVL